MLCDAGRVLLQRQSSRNANLRIKKKTNQLLCPVVGEVRYTDQDRKLFKLQVAAQHYESNLEMSYNYLPAFALAVLVLSLGGTLSNQFPWLAGVLMWFASFLVSALLLWRHIREYNATIERLDLHLQNLERGQPAPSLRADQRVASLYLSCFVVFACYGALALNE